MLKVYLLEVEVVLMEKEVLEEQVLLQKSKPVRVLNSVWVDLELLGSEELLQVLELVELLRVLVQLVLELEVWLQELEDLE